LELVVLVAQTFQPKVQTEPTAYLVQLQVQAVVAVGLYMLSLV
tara:strand:+ start:1115 stop:1243 length:129 start_codon:yes stop_codon:yes gene_type:complete